MRAIEAALGAHSATNFYKGLSGGDIVASGGLFVATLLTLLVVPALYALWFRVRAAESSDTSVERLRLTDQIGRGPMPMPIAAE